MIEIDTDKLPAFATGGYIGKAGIDRDMIRIPSCGSYLPMSTTRQLGRETFEYINRTGKLPGVRLENGNLVLEGPEMNVKRIVALLRKALLRGEQQRGE